MRGPGSGRRRFERAGWGVGLGWRDAPDVAEDEEGALVAEGVAETEGWEGFATESGGGVGVGLGFGVGVGTGTVGVLVAGAAFSAVRAEESPVQDRTGTWGFAVSGLLAEGVGDVGLESEWGRRVRFIVRSSL